MRNLFALMFVSFFVSGCYLSHERPSDAGTVAPDSALPPTGGVVVTCESRAPHTELQTGESGVVFGMDVIPGDRAVFLRRAGFDFGWSGAGLWGNVFGYESGRPYFTDWYLAATFPSRILNDAPGVIVPNGEERRGSVNIITFPWREELLTEPTHVHLRTTVASTEEGRHALTYGYYNTRLTDIDFMYEDTGLSVPASEVVLRGCESSDVNTVFVRANYAQAIVDRTWDFTPPEARGIVVDHPALLLIMLNDGARAGTLQSFSIDTHAVRVYAAGREEPFVLDPVTQACSLFQEGRRIARGTRGSSNRFAFSDLAIVIPGRVSDSTEQVEVRCDFDPSTLGPGEVVRVSLSADYTDFRLLEPAPSYVEGTLLLAQNHLQPLESRVWVTITH